MPRSRYREYFLELERVIFESAQLSAVAFLGNFNVHRGIYPRYRLNSDGEIGDPNVHGVLVHVANRQVQARYGVSRVHGMIWYPFHSIPFVIYLQYTLNLQRKCK